MGLIVNTRYSERRLTMFTSNYKDSREHRARFVCLPSRLPDALAAARDVRVRCTSTAPTTARLARIRRHEDIAAMAARRSPAARRQNRRRRHRCRPKAGSQAKAQTQKARERRQGRPEVARRPRRIAVEPVLGLYVHVPFCSAICNYCNFNRGSVRRGAEGAVRRARSSREIARAGRRVAGRHHLLRRRHAVAARASRSAERHRRVPRRRSTSPPTPRSRSRPIPETVTPRPAGGLSRRRRQSSQLRRPVVPRRRAAASEPAAFRRAGARGLCRWRATAGFDNISLDLMMWLPQQSVERLARRRSMRSSRLGPDHASLYLLEIYPNAPLQRRDGASAVVAGARRRRGGDVSGGDGPIGSTPGTSSTRFRTSRRPGRESRHNLKYWTDGEWLGLRLRRALDARRRPAEERRLHRRLHCARRGGQVS